MMKELELWLPPPPNACNFQMHDKAGLRKHLIFKIYKKKIKCQCTIHTFAISEVSVPQSVLLKHIFKLHRCMNTTAPIGLKVQIILISSFHVFNRLFNCHHKCR